MNLSRITRLLRLIGHLQSGRGNNTRELARKCRVSRRTIFRDIESLRAAGVPLRFDDAHQSYHIAEQFYLPPTHLTADEAMAVIVLSNEMGREGGLPFYQAAQSAALKLEGMLPERLRTELGNLTRKIRIHRDALNPLSNHADTYRQLVEATATSRHVRIRYSSLTEWEEISTRVSPYRVLFSRRSWYVIGRSSLHRAVRTFNIGRITRLETLDETFKVPKGFTLRGYLRNAWCLIPDGPDQKVVVRFDPIVAQNVAEVAWHDTQKLSFNDDGSLDFEVTVSGLNEISWWILGYGDRAEVLRPEALRDLIRRHARRMVERYD